MMEPVKIIGIAGYATSGKDEMAKALIESFIKTHPFLDSLGRARMLKSPSFWKVKKFAYGLKECCAITMNVPPAWFENKAFMEKLAQPEFWINNKPTTNREFVQVFGTTLRDNLNPDIWVNGLFSSYSNDLWIITDVRFPNEFKKIKQMGGIVIRVTRPGVEPVNSHKSETSLDPGAYDILVNNDGSLSDLQEKADAIVNNDKRFFNEAR